MNNKRVYCLFLIVIVVMIFGARKGSEMPTNVVINPISKPRLKPRKTRKPRKPKSNKKRSLNKPKSSKKRKLNLSATRRHSWQSLNKRRHRKKRSKNSERFKSKPRKRFKPKKRLSKRRLELRNRPNSMLRSKLVWRNKKRRPKLRSLLLKSQRRRLMRSSKQ